MQQPQSCSTLHNVLNYLNKRSWIANVLDFFFSSASFLKNNHYLATFPKCSLPQTLDLGTQDFTSNIHLQDLLSPFNVECFPKPKYVTLADMIKRVNEKALLGRQISN